MKVALATGIARIPPTYFLTDHAQALAADFDFRLFALAADVADSAVTVPVEQALGLRGLAFPLRMKLAPLAAAALGRAIESFAPDVIHQHFATWSTSAVNAARRTGVPLITTVHGYDIGAAQARSRSPLDVVHRHNVAQARKHSTLVLAVSRYLADRAVAAGFDSARLEVHYQGVDTDYFTPGDATTEKPSLVFVGALSELKGVRDLVEASLRLHQHAAHDLVIVGSGPLHQELLELTKDSPHVRLVGVLDKAGVREAMRAATAVVLPTQQHKGRREAAGLVLLEAQACGTPVIAYGSGGTPEMLRPDETGVLVPEGDGAALEAAIREVLQLGAVELTRMRAAARAFVVEHRSLTRSCAELSEHYRSATAL